MKNKIKSAALLVILVIGVGGLMVFAQTEDISVSQPKSELVADQDGVYHLILTGEEGQEAFSQIPSDAIIEVHDSLQIRESLKEARESGDFDEIYEPLSPEEMENRPPIEITDMRAPESYGGAHNTHCGNGETVSSWWLKNTSAKPDADDGVEDHSHIIFQQDAHPWWNYVLFKNWGNQCPMEIYYITC